MALHGNVAILTRLQDTAAAVQQLKQTNPQVADVTVLSVAADSDVAQTVASSSGAFDVIVAFNEQTEQLGAELGAMLPLLKDGGALQLHVANVQEEKKNAVLMALMIGGLVDTTHKEEASPFYPEFVGAVSFSSKKQSFESAAIPLAKKTTTTAQPIKKWTVLADDFGDEAQDDDIIDEDTLLDDTDEVLQAAKADCDEKVGGKKRACKNCTCGLKDEEDKPVMSEKDLNKLVSGCGNCFKGDAFRCGSCPFLGKPAFKPGMEKVLLNLDNADDI
ncbi:Anamorsin [Phytophthora fragariae]|uniref:Anamorsin homolog n=1 Tax=Phytophthora fragariae TaxID=53985 RepID=A0A6A3UH84_9STRA|nr:Anamorsin [Phytophthora fragariae]KAE8950280.1 Anamorsin [Phytophthora fragariae]KAE9021203.1 Anamorsin [Phytophthora fragariae]KAE9140510.1 Anamorsin [Phytophthora fragariae]KAE9141472.1 Anamorsin [Phytophthora fragariae]